MLSEIRRALRDKLLRAVEEVFERYEEVAERRHRSQLAAVSIEADRVIGAMHDAVRELRTTIQDFETRTRRDVLAAGEREAVGSTARFVATAMPTARTFPSPDSTLEHAVTLALPEGMALEFGVYSGHTLKMISAARAGRAVYGFDSFEGLPEAWRSGFPAGTFGVGRLPDVPGAELVVGWFEDTLPRFVAEHSGPVALLHLDADLYSSTRTVLDLVGPRLLPGSIVVFDEYFNYPGWEQHEYRAWQEYVERTGTRYEYVGYTLDNEQVIVRVTGVSAAG
ncbi:MAG: class I SAM-dependent methyltransferase [Pseudonocardia sp.]